MLVLTQCRYSAVTLMVVTVVNGASSWPASYAVAGEASALSLRAKAQGISWFFSAVATCISGICLPYIYNPDAGNLRAKTGFVYTGLCALGALVTWISVPEMKGRSPIEIDKMFEMKLATKEFAKWRNTNVGRIDNRE